MTDTGRWVPTIEAQALASGQMVGVEIFDLRIALYNLDGSLHATANVCTHAFALLSDGWLDENMVECPLHGGRFNVCNGKAQGDPVDVDLEVFQVRISEGFVEVFVPA